MLRVFSFQQITNGLDWHSLQESANPNFGRSRTRPAKCDGSRFPGADPAPVIAPLGNYSVAEGFDDARLDTLFLTMPISWKGTLAQYVGRLHRQHAGKSDVLVFDYVDESVPVLARMAAKRRAGYRTLGYETR